MLSHTIEEVTLKNGAKGLFIDVPSASVMSFRINFRAGDVYTPSEEKWETAHIMEHLSLGANKKYRSARDYQAELEKNGAYSNASTGPTEMIYEAECADFEWQRVAELFLMGISQPLFLEQEFTAECGNVYEELVGRGNNHGNRLYFEMAKRYGLRVKTMQERARLMQNVSLADIQHHYKKTHFSANMRFIIAGKLRGRRSALKHQLLSMPLPSAPVQSERFHIPPETPRCVETPLYVRNKTVPNAYFYIDTYRTSELSVREGYALSLLGTILTDTLYSRILGEARENGLIYYLSSSFYRTAGHSAWWFGSQVSEKQLMPFLDIFVREIQRIQDGKLNKKDIEAAKMYQLGGHQRSAQTVNAIVNGYSGLYFYNEKIDDYYTRFPEKIGRVSKEQMVSVAQSMFSEKIWGLGFLGSISEDARLSAHKKLEPLWS